MLVGAVVGAFIGAAMGGWKGALALGFLGWLTGLIVQSSRRKPSKPAGITASAPNAWTYDQRIERLEKMVASLQREIAALKGEPPPIVTTPPPTVEPTPGIETRPPEIITTTPPEIVGADADRTVPEAGAVPPQLEIPRVPPPVPKAETVYRTAPGPKEPERGLFERLLEGNLVAKAGVVILFFGMAFLLKFAYDRGLFPPWMRLASVLVAAIVMFFLGRWLLGRYRNYALVLMGGAMGLAYLDVFFALKTFEYIGPGTGFILFAILGLATLFLAVRLDARAFAALGLLGGFLAPILASTGRGDHVILFSYYLGLNLVIFATSWFKSWRELNFLGFLFTFIIASLWGHEHYRPELFDTTEPFLVAFWALYVAIPIVFSFKQPPQLRGIVDGTLVFGTPLCASMLQTALTRGMPDSVLAWSAAIASVVYGVLALALWRREKMRILAEAHLALAVVFGTVAPYFAWGGYPTFAFWTIEGAAIHWIGCRQRSRLARIFAELLQLGGAAYFMWVTRAYHSTSPWINEMTVGCAIIAAAGLVTARSIATHGEALIDRERALEQPAVAWSMLWLSAAAWYAIIHGLGGTYAHHAAMLGTLGVMELVLEFAGAALAWTALRRGNMIPRILLAGFALFWFYDHRNPLAYWLWAGWATAVAAGYFALWRQDRDKATLWGGVQLAVVGWTVIGILAHAARLSALHNSWGEAWQLGLPAFVFAAAIASFVADWKSDRWPVRDHREVLRAAVLVPLMVIAGFWTLVANVQCDGDARPFAYLPLLNPMDLGQLALLVAAAWAGSEGGPVQRGMKVLPAVGVAAFFWLNGLVLRTVHQWTGVRYDLDALLRSVVAQAALSLLWTVTALALMFWAGKRASRGIWMVGATLLGAVVLKLFINDLGNTGTVARIVSFIGVGVLMLVIGFLSPIPPKVAPSRS